MWAIKFSPDTLRQKQSLGYLEAQLGEDRRVLRFLLQRLDHESAWQLAQGCKALRELSANN